MLYYHPSVPQAYADIKDLQFVVSSGMFLRNLHRWSAQLMVFLVFAHMFKVFYRGAYRAPREFNWVVGIVLLIITLLLSYTGYLLPWDQFGILGHHGWVQYLRRRSPGGQQDPFPAAGWQPGKRKCSSAVLRLALCGSATCGNSLHRCSLLAHSQRRWSLRAAVEPKPAHPC